LRNTATRSATGRSQPWQTTAAAGDQPPAVADAYASTMWLCGNTYLRHSSHQGRLLTAARTENLQMRGQPSGGLTCSECQRGTRGDLCSSPRRLESCRGLPPRDNEHTRIKQCHSLAVSAAPHHAQGIAAAGLAAGCSGKNLMVPTVAGNRRGGRRSAARGGGGNQRDGSWSRHRLAISGEHRRDAGYQEQSREEIG